MLIPDGKYSEYACDVLIFPDKNGEMSDARLNDQFRVRIHKHYIERLTPDILKSFRTDFVVCYVSGSDVNPLWLYYALDEMVKNEATAYLSSDEVNIAPPGSWHNFSAATGVVSRDLFVEMMLLDRRMFWGHAICDPRWLVSNPPISLQLTEVPTEPVSCDVIVPFINKAYLSEVFDALLTQNRANCVIHAIDDCSGQDISDLVAAYPMIRWYRNRQNIGQFMSANNVFDRCETDYIAINDADDISEPDRIWLSITALELGCADVYGSQTSQFIQGGDPAPPYNHYSIKPYNRENNIHPIVHGTMVVRKSVFRRLNGYTDFGDLDQNKCGNDTEFMMRAFYFGYRFHIGQSKLMRIRIHGSSCTNVLNHDTTPRQTATNIITSRLGSFKQKGFDPALFGAGFENSGVTESL
jgi:hypothetical protein